MSIQIEIPDHIVQAIRLPVDEHKQQLLVELAVALYARGILSFGKARELTGLSKYKFGQLLGRRAAVETEIEKLKAAISVRTPAELRSLTGEIVEKLRLLANGTPQTKKRVIHSLVERLEISQRKIVRLVPTAKAAPFFTALMSVDIGVKPAYA